MRIKLEIGNGPVEVICHVDLANKEVKSVEYMGRDISDALELETLDMIVTAAQKKFAEEMSEP